MTVATFAIRYLLQFPLYHKFEHASLGIVGELVAVPGQEWNEIAFENGFHKNDLGCVFVRRKISLNLCQPLCENALPLVLRRHVNGGDIETKLDLAVYDVMAFSHVDMDLLCEEPFVSRRSIQKFFDVWCHVFSIALNDAFQPLRLFVSREASVARQFERGTNVKRSAINFSNERHNRRGALT